MIGYLTLERILDFQDHGITAELGVKARVFFQQHLPSVSKNFPVTCMDSAKPNERLRPWWDQARRQPGWAYAGSNL
jgi:hypothetical protein